MRSISVFGLGYVGSVTAACFAMRGHRVLGIDINSDKVSMLHGGKSPILEPGIEHLITTAHKQGLLDASSDIQKVVTQTEISFLCVGTPSQSNGKLDTRGLQRVCEQIGTVLKDKSDFHIVVTRSTILPGTTTELVVPTLEKASGKKAGTHFGVATNPEFMREGSAIKDFLEPPLTVLGISDERSQNILRELYEWAPAELFAVPVQAAEMVKYACNSYHALKVGFANEIGYICKALGVDTEAVTEIFLSDKRLNVSAAYLRPGFAFGGSCLPKDVRALTYRARELDCKVPLLEAIMPSNQEHIERALQAIFAIGKRKIALLGLSFKAGTDDLRESPQVYLIKRLLGEGYEVKIWDENVFLGKLLGSNRQYIEEQIPHIGLLLHENITDVLKSADVVIIGTSVERERLLPLLAPQHSVVDLVNLNHKKRVAKAAVAYSGLCW
jgi:GDP-mannose 6-dehydrogenase